MRRIRPPKLLEPAGVRRGLIIFLVLMNFRTFEYFPGFRPLQEGWYLFSLSAFVIVYPLFKVILDWTFTKVELYLLVAIPVLFIIPAVSAHSTFGQPYIYGILPQRSAFPVLLWILFLNAWRCGWFDAEDIEQSLLYTVWGTFALFTLLRLVLNPARFDIPGFVVGVGGQAYFSFSAFFNMFGLVYYIFSGLRTGNKLHYLYGLMFMYSSIGGSGRSLLVSIVATLAFFLVLWRGPIRALPVMAGFIFILGFVLGLGYLVKPKETAERVEKFYEALQVLGGASEVEDYSAQARLDETAVAKPYVAEHPFFGAGAVSLQWGGGLVAAVGDYFVPGDIGMLGIAFTYGLVGLSYLVAQYFFVIAAYRRLAKGYATPLSDAIIGFSLLTFIYSNVAALFAFNIETTSFFVVVATLLGTGPSAASSAVSVGPPKWYLSRYPARKTLPA